MATASFALLIPRMYSAREVWVPLAPADVVSEGSGLRGVTRQGVPPWRPHWSGRPPLALIVDRITGAVVAPSVLSRSSLEANASGILWTPQDDYALTALQAEWRLTPAPPGLADLIAIFEANPDLPPASLVLAAGCGLGLAFWALRILVSQLGARGRLPSATALAFSRWLALALGLAAAWLRFSSPLWRSGDTDAGTISSFAAAARHPLDLAPDALLHNAQHGSWYTGLYLSLAGRAEVLGFDFDHAFAMVALVAASASLLGYYHVLQRLAGSETLALALSIAITTMTLGYPPNESWGFGQALPRTAFAGALPWCLLLFMRLFRRKPQWPFLGACGATTVVLHPVSAPALAGAFGCSLALSRRPTWRVVGALLGFALAVLLVFAVLGRDHTARTLAAGRSTASEDGPPPEFLASMAPSAVAFRLAAEPRHMVRLTIFAIALWYASRRYPRTCRIVIGGILGLLVVALGISALDWYWATWRGRSPMQIDLGRNVRYLEVAGLIAVALAARRSRYHGPTAAGRVLSGKHVRGVGGLLLAALYLQPLATTARTTVNASAAALRAAAGRLDAVSASRLEVLRFLQTRADLGRTWAASDLDFARAYSIPLAYTWKDPWILSYVDRAAMRSALREVHKADALGGDGFDRLDALELLAASNASRAVFYRRDSQPELVISPLRQFANDRYLIVGPPPREMVQSDSSGGQWP